ncbi:MAG TPA: hypothetical protein VJ483_04400 [Holophagaceae bacterium]|nr:hypothetical protein [Holophagaceae bacterium]
MGTIFSPEDLAKLRARLDALEPARAPLWGRLTAPRMAAHVAAALRMGLGEVVGDPGPAVLRHWPMN